MRTLKHSLLTSHISLLIFFSIVFMACGDTASSSNDTETEAETTEQERLEEENVEERVLATSATLQEQLDAALAGQTVVIEETEFSGTIVIPPGVNLMGKEGNELVVTPKEGQPGVTCTGQGNSDVSHIRVENASGAGILIDGCSMTLNNVIVTGTKAGGKLPGHGILVQNAPTFKALRVSSTLNEGSGLEAVATTSVIISHPLFAPIPQDLIEGASRVVIHPQFLPEDESSISVIHPQFTPDEDDGVAVIHPQFSENEEDYLVVIHPQFMTGSEFSDNGQNGIVVIHPQFMKINSSRFVSINGVTAAKNGNTGISLLNTGQAKIANTAISQNKGEGESYAGLKMSETSAFISGSYIADNAGSGIRLKNSAITVSKNGQQFSPRLTEQGSDTAVIHPQFMPELSVENNVQGGMSIVNNSLLTEEGKADGFAGIGITLNSTLVRNNHEFGIQAACSRVTLDNSVIESTSSHSSSSGGTGLEMNSDGECPETTSFLAIEKDSLVLNNDGIGIAVRHGSQVTLKGVVAGNRKGGILASDVGSSVKIRNVGLCLQGLEQDGCIPPVIADNHIVGVAMGESTELVMDSAVIARTRKADDSVSSLDGFGDGILLEKPASALITRSKVTESDRAGVVVINELLSAGILPAISITNSSFEKSPYGGVWITPQETANSPFTPDLELDVPAFWLQMMASCTTDGATHNWVDLGCLPCMPTSCSLGEEGCETILPCGACSAACTETDDEACSMDACLCPEDAQCCTQTDCLYTEVDPFDCDIPVCNDDFTCGFIEKEDCGPQTAETNECTTDADCTELNVIGAAGCKELACVDKICVQVIAPDSCSISNKEGTEFCYSEGETSPVNPCEICIPVKSQSAFTQLNGEPCDDGLGCTEDTVCLSGQCGGGSSFCDDGNVCTEETCAETSQGPICSVSPVETEGCCTSDSDCSNLTAGCGTGICVAGSCVASTEATCDDGNACTTDYCSLDADGGFSCSHEPLCLDDGNPCTNVTCEQDEETGAPTCVTTPNDNGICDDGVNCTLDSCSGGECKHAADDGMCYGDSICDPLEGCTDVTFD